MCITGDKFIAGGHHHNETEIRASTDTGTVRDRVIGYYYKVLTSILLMTIVGDSDSTPTADFRYFYGCVSRSKLH